MGYPYVLQLNMKLRPLITTKMDFLEPIHGSEATAWTTVFIVNATHPNVTAVWASCLTANSDVYTDGDHCLLCDSLFSMTDRKHHCKQCDALVCAKCWTTVKDLRYIGKGGADNVCDVCHERDELGDKSLC